MGAYYRYNYRHSASQGLSLAAKQSRVRSFTHLVLLPHRAFAREINSG